MNTYQITHEDKGQELNTIKEIFKKQWVSSTNNTPNTKTESFY
jgi:hypothetical protein